jgi:hypothetical protein
MNAVVNVLWMETVVFEGEEESASCSAEDVIFESQMEVLLSTDLQQFRRTTELGFAMLIEDCTSQGTFLMCSRTGLPEC